MLKNVSYQLERIIFVQFSPTMRCDTRSGLFDLWVLGWPVFYPMYLNRSCEELDWVTPTAATKALRIKYLSTSQDLSMSRRIRRSRVLRA